MKKLMKLKHEKKVLEKLDGCCDVIYVALGLMDAMGIDGTKLSIRTRCNMSKFCDTEIKKSVKIFRR